MAPRIVLFGATGFTGRLMAERLVAAGERPVLAGRDPERLKALADRLGADLETVKADVLRHNSVFALVGAVTCSSRPSGRSPSSATRAARRDRGRRHLHRLDRRAGFIRRVFEEFDAPAGAAAPRC